MRTSLKATIRKNLSNIPGWNTSRKLIIFESDDWGTVRTSSIEDVKNLSAKGYDFETLDAHRYSYNDTLATEEDLASLFEILSGIKDKNDNPAVFTAMSIVANPDFSAIRESGFTEYKYEPFTETLKRQKGCEKSFELWKAGITEKIFYPQFHGREHLNVLSWLNALQEGHKETLDVFQTGMWGYVNSFCDDRRINYQEAFNFYDPKELKYLEEVIIDGLRLFEEIFGYQARLFVPPNGLFSSKLEGTLARSGIDSISLGKIQMDQLGYGKARKVIHYPGQKNSHDQIYLTRNCFFEPGSMEMNDWVDNCLTQIKLAFRWKKPAIISTHRVNYIGSLNPENRQRGLKQLERLLSGIMRNWPDAEFLTSTDLSDLMRGVRKNG